MTVHEEEDEFIRFPLTGPGALTTLVSGANAIGANATTANRTTANRTTANRTTANRTTANTTGANAIKPRPIKHVRLISARTGRYRPSTTSESQ